MALTVGDNAYCDKNDVETLLGAFTIPAAWTDALVETAILRATQRIDALCGTHFGSRSMTLLCDGASNELLPLDDYTRWPINSVTDVYERADYDASDNFDTYGGLVDDDDYRIHVSGHALERTDGGNWTRGKHNYRVRGTFGTGSLPAQIKAACVLLIREEITPGTARDYEQFASEKWPDGYSYTRKSGVVEPGGASHTGVPAVDALLQPFVNQLPGIGLIDF